jgi:radical SAM superfamily enzyme YgiQ (UPF0313 family)
MFIGVESINPEALKDYHKSQTVAMIKDSIHTLTSSGLRVHSMFILGADSDNEETIERSIQFARDSGSWTVQFSSMTGTIMTEATASYCRKTLHP